MKDFVQKFFEKVEKIELEYKGKRGLAKAESKKRKADVAKTFREWVKKDFEIGVYYLKEAGDSLKEAGKYFVDGVKAIGTSIVMTCGGIGTAVGGGIISICCGLADYGRLWKGAIGNVVKDVKEWYEDVTEMRAAKKAARDTVLAEMTPLVKKHAKALIELYSQMDQIKRRAGRFL